MTHIDKKLQKIQYLAKNLLNSKWNHKEKNLLKRYEEVPEIEPKLTTGNFQDERSLIKIKAKKKKKGNDAHRKTFNNKNVKI